MANDISLSKFRSFRDTVLRTGLEYMQEKASAMKLEENSNSKSNSSENDRAVTNQRG